LLASSAIMGTAAELLAKQLSQDVVQQGLRRII